MNLSQYPFFNKDLLHLVESSQLFIHLYTKDIKGKYVDCNDQQAYNVGLKPEEFIGLYDVEISNFKDESQFRLNDLKVINELQPHLFIEQDIVFDKLFTGISHKMPLLSGTKKVIGVTGISIIIDSSPITAFNKPCQSATQNALTRREIECLFNLIKGKTAKQTAIILSISHRTVEQHIENCKVKLNCHNRNELIEKAFQVKEIKQLLLHDIIY